MIYAMTPNPALDLGGTVKRLQPNEKSYVHDETRFPGGNGVNAARIISRLGVPVVAGGFLGGGIGKEFEELLKNEGVRHRFVKIKGNTRISVTVSSAETQRQTRLSFPGPHISTREQVYLMKAVSELRSPTLLIIGGSLPPGIAPSFIRKIIQKASSKGISSVVDIPGHVLKKIISVKPIFIKPNLVEFQELVGKKVRTRESVLKCARSLTKFIPLICVSSVEGGALLVTSSHAWFGTLPKVKIKSTVGAGDSMVGAISAELWKQKIITRGAVDSLDLATGASLLRHGLAAACATLTTHGTDLGTKTSIRHYLPLISVISLDPIL